MRTMKNNNNETVMVIGIDHGYGNMKTATRCFPSGVAKYDKEPIFQNNLLVYNGMYYQIGEEHKEFCAEKTQDEDYYVLTLAAIAKELDGKGMNRAKVHIAAGLPLTWHLSVQGKAPVELFIAVATQKEDFQKYLLQNEYVDFTFHNKEYHVEFAGADIYPQGFAAAFYRLQDFKGINMLADIGNGTMNIMYINNSRPLEKKCFTEKYGTHQCVLAVRESLLKELGTVVDDLVIEQVIRTGTADIGEKYLAVIRRAAGELRNYYRELDAAIADARGITDQAQSGERYSWTEFRESESVHTNTEKADTDTGRRETDDLIRQAEIARRSSEINRRNSASDNRTVRNAEAESIASAEQRRSEEQKWLNEQKRARAARKRNKRRLGPEL